MSKPAIVIIGTHGEVVYKQTIANSIKSDIKAAFHVATWPEHVKVKGIVMPVGGSVHYADEVAEKSVKKKVEQSSLSRITAVKTTVQNRLMDYFDQHLGNSKVRELADSLLALDTTFQSAYSAGSKSVILPDMADIEEVPCLDLIKGANNSSNVVNYTPYEYSNTGEYQIADMHNPKVPLIFKNYLLSSEEASIGQGHADLSEKTLGSHLSTKKNAAYTAKRAESKRTFTEWHITLLHSQDSTIVEEPILEKLLQHPLADTEHTSRVRVSSPYRTTSSQQIINYLISRGFDNILIIDITCCVFRPEVLGIKSQTPDNLFTQIREQKKLIGNSSVSRLFDELMTRWFQMYLYSLINPSQHHSRRATPAKIMSALDRYKYLIDVLAITGDWAAYYKTISGLRPLEGGYYIENTKNNRSRRNIRRRYRRRSVRKY
jgi:hypothetical protein